MGRGVVNQVVNHVTGMRMSAIYAPRLEQAAEAYAYATPAAAVVARTQAELDAAWNGTRPSSPTIRSCCAGRRISTP
jgi:predicted homoserine dehydrogenase-like protein